MNKNASLGSFGDIFAYHYLDSKEKYIYLGQTKLEIVYLARILNFDQTKLAHQQEENFNKTGRPYEEFSLWFVRLTTEEYKDLAALITGSQHDITFSQKLVRLDSSHLDRDDKIKLKEKILTATTWDDLKEYVRDLKV